MIDLHRFAFLREKGIVPPFPMSSQGITGVTRPAWAMPACDSGLGSPPHPANHAETLTSPIAHRTSALHLASERVPASGNAGHKYSLFGKTLGSDCPIHRQGVRLPACLTAYFLLLWPSRQRDTGWKMKPFDAQLIYNSRMHSCPVITLGNRLSRTKDYSRVRPAALWSGTARFYAIFEFAKLYQVHKTITWTFCKKT